MNREYLFQDPASDFAGSLPANDELILHGKRGKLFAYFLKAGGEEKKPTVLLLQAVSQILCKHQIMV